MKPELREIELAKLSEDDKEKLKNGLKGFTISLAIAAAEADFKKLKK